MQQAQLYGRRNFNKNSQFITMDYDVSTTSTTLSKIYNGKDSLIEGFLYFKKERL